MNNPLFVYFSFVIFYVLMFYYWIFTSVAVDGDPHFVVQLPKLHQNLCFTVDGRANDVLRLLEDPDRGTLFQLDVESSNDRC